MQFSGKVLDVTGGHRRAKHFMAAPGETQRMQEEFVNTCFTTGIIKTSIERIYKRKCQ